MNRLMGVAAALTIVLAIPAIAQMGPPPPGSVPGGGGQGPGNHMGQNNMTQEQFNQFSDYVDQARRLTADDRAHGKTEADLKAEDIAAAAGLVKTLNLSCEVADAELLAQGTRKENGTEIKSIAYEAACKNGMGYLLVNEQPGKPYGVSCFTAQAKRLAAPNQEGIVCKLAADADTSAVATALLARAGKSCSVKQVGWIGFNDATHTEYNEAVCSDGGGFMLATAMPGSNVEPRATACHDSAMQGIPCKVASNGNAGPVITVQTFKDALAQRGVVCDATDVRVVGQQNASKRYVVEFRCPQRPKGLVALIPLAGNTQPFETMDCVAAAKIGAACKLTGAP